MLSNFQVAIPTYFEADETLNIKKTANIAQYLLNKGVRDILIFGSTGEQHSISTDEKIETLNYLEENKNSENQWIFGVSGIRQKDVLRLAERITLSSLQYIMLGFPPYIRPTQKEALSYAFQIIEAAQKEVIIYNNPLRTGFDIAISSYQELLKHPLVIGIKEAGNPENIPALKDMGFKFRAFIGGEVDMIKKLELGFDSICSVLGSLYPDEVKAIIDDFFQNKLSEAQEKYERILRIHNEKSQNINLLVNLKKSLTEFGVDAGYCRAPLGVS